MTLSGELIFCPKNGDAFNLAKAVAILEKHNGSCVLETSLVTEAFFIGTKSFGTGDPVPEAYSSYVKSFAAKYGLQYAVTYKKGNVIYGWRKEKKQQFIVSESLAYTGSLEHLWTTAQMLADTNVRSQFTSYRNNAFYQRVASTEVIGQMAAWVVDETARHSGMNLLRLDPRVNEQSYCGAHIWLTVGENYFGYLCRESFDPDYIYEKAYSDYGYGQLRADQIEGMTMALYQELYEQLQKKYPYAVITPFCGEHNLWGYRLISKEYPLKSW